MKIDIKVLSVNEAWQGQRFKTPLYKQFERELIFKLPQLDFNPSKDDLVTITFGVSSPLFDIDNGLKPLLDVLQKKYGFNDRYIYHLRVDKVIVPKGSEYVEIDVKNI